MASVDTRVTLYATLDLPDLDAPAQALLMSLPENARPLLNDIVIHAGRYLAPGAANEVLISGKFAAARGLKPGDSLRAIINGRMQDLHIVGIADSPEHTYSVPPGSLYPDDKRYGVLWMSRKVLGPAYDMDGAFNEAMVSAVPRSQPAGGEGAARHPACTLRWLGCISTQGPGLARDPAERARSE